jgi:Heavy metal associated domain 2
MSITEGETPSVNGSASAEGLVTPGPVKLRIHRKHHARIEHKVRGRIRLKVPHGRVDPSILEAYRETFGAIPGILSVSTKPDSGSIVIHYDPAREREFEHHFQQASDQHLHMAEPVPPEDEVDKLAGRIEAEAEFLAAHSNLARSTVEFCKTMDRELKLATGNNIDLKIVLAVGLAAYTFLEIGGTAATPMWVTLALFSLNHFVELHTDHRAELEQARAQAAAS